MAIGMLFGIDPSFQTLVEAFVKQKPSTVDVVAFLRMLPFDQWKAAGQALIIAGVPVDIVEAGVGEVTRQKTTWIKNTLVVLSGGAAAFHGIRRNDSLLMGAWWFLMGVTFPIATNVIALAQGYGKPKKRC